MRLDDCACETCETEPDSAWATIMICPRCEATVCKGCFYDPAQTCCICRPQEPD